MKSLKYILFAGAVALLAVSCKEDEPTIVIPTQPVDTVATPEPTVDPVTPEPTYPAAQGFGFAYEFLETGELNIDVQILLADGYSGPSVKVDKEYLLTYLGLTELPAFDAYEDQSDFYFASFNADGSEAAWTANGYGSWYDAAGNVIAYGDEAMCFFEFDPASCTFGTGIFPEHPVEGDQFVMKAMMSGLEDKEIPITITIDIVTEREDLTDFTTWETVDVNVSLPYSAEYVTTTVDLYSNLASTFAGALDDFGALNADGTRGGMTANNGAWFDADGNTISWGATAVAFWEYDNEATISIGNYPNEELMGTSVEMKMFAVYGDKQQVLTYFVSIE